MEMNQRSAAPQAPQKKAARAAKPHRRSQSPVWSLVLGYIASLLLVVLALFGVLATTLCSPAFMQKAVQRSAFGAAAYSLLVDNYTSYAAATGFAPEVLTDQISETQIEADMKQSVAETYEGNTAYNAHGEVAQAIYDAMVADLGERGIEITDTVDEGLVTVAEGCRLDYANYIGVPLRSQLYTLLHKIDRVMWIGLVVSALLCALALVLLARLAPGAKTAVRCLFFAFAAATVLCLLVAFGVYPLSGISGIRLSPTSLRLLVLQYVKDLLGRFGVFGAVYGLAATALAVLNNMAGAKAKQRARNAANK